MRKLFMVCVPLLSLSGCLTGTPGNVTPITGFEVERYMGTWYELYRLDHSFERGLDNVTATYTLLDDNSVRVVNAGMREDGTTDTAVGRALFQGDPTVGSLKVSFFGPFYGGYHIIALDKENYDYAMVAGPTFNFLWILSRTPDLDQEIIDGLIEQAADSGFPTEELIEVDQR